MPLPQALTAVDPSSRDAIKKDGGFASLKQLSDPAAPFIRETTAAKDTIEAVPVNAIKSFVEVQLQNDGGRASLITAVEQFSSIHKAVRYASS